MLSAVTILQEEVLHLDQDLHACASSAQMDCLRFCMEAPVEVCHAQH